MSLKELLLLAVSGEETESQGMLATCQRPWDCLMAEQVRSSCEAQRSLGEGQCQLTVSSEAVIRVTQVAGSG